MARRDLEVRVRADVGAYQKAMSSAVKSTDQLGQAALRAQKVGLKMSNVGDKLTKSVTLPLALAGAAALKLATDFDKSFTTMQTLAGVSAGEVDHLKESVLDLAGETGRAPQELAEALYFLQSSGLDGAAAMDALEVSAKASAAGLGETQVIADAVSSAMLGYAKSGLTAAEATDVLVETARQGKAEPAELAAQMGRLIPVASELGITFGDVGGAIAALSTKGFNAEQATTALVNVMGKLLKPSIQASEQLEAVGLSTDAIRQSIAEKGLLATLEELRARLGENGFIKFLEDQQAVQGGLALLGGDLDKTKEIFAEVNDSVGATENAFSTWAQSMGAENAQAFATFQVALINLGDVIVPIATDIISVISKIAEAFSDLPGGIQHGIVYLGLLAAAAGPVLAIGGRLITTFGTLTRMLGEFAVPAGAVSGAFNGGAAAGAGLSATLVGLGVAIAAVSTGFALFLKAKNDAKVEEAAVAFAELDSVTREAAAAALDLNNAVGQNQITFETTASAADQFAESGKLTEQAMEDLDERFGKVLDKAPQLAESFIDNASQIGVSREKLAEWRDELEEKIATDAEAVNSQDEYNAAVEEAAGRTLEAVSALQQYNDALKAQFDPLFGAINATRELEAANAAETAAEVTLAAAIRDHGAGSAEAVAAQDALTEAQLATTQAAIGQESALVTLKDAVDNGSVSVEDAKATLARWVAQGTITQASAATTSRELDRMAGAADSIPERVGVDVSANTSGAYTKIVQVRDAVGQLRDKTITIGVTTALSGQAVALMNNKLLSGQRAHGGPVGAGRLYEVAEQGRAELLEMAGRTYLIPGADGTVVPAMSAAGGGGGGGTVINQFSISLNGPIGSEAEAVRWLGKAMRAAGDSGVPLTVRGRRVA